MVFGMTFLWGFADSGVNTHLSEILGFEFENNVEPYSIFNLIQSLSVFVVLIIEAFIKFRAGYFFFNAICGVLGVLMVSSSLRVEYRHDRLEALRQSVIIETNLDQSMGSKSRRHEMDRIIERPDRKIVIDFEISNSDRRNESP